MPALINTKLGQNRGRPRFWVEGMKLAREGITPGRKYRLDFNDGKMVLDFSGDDGDRTVSRRKRRDLEMPIIDITAGELAEIFKDCDALRVVVKGDRIIVSAHPSEEKIREREARLIEKLNTSEPLQIASLFHGGGVLDKALHRGLKSAGVTSYCKLAVELEEAYIESSLRNNPEIWREDSIIFQGGIQQAVFGNSKFSIEGLTAGIPCTGASRSGAAKNKLSCAEEHDAAGSMFFYFLRFVETLNPAFILIENVPTYQNTASMMVIRQVLDNLGYTLQETVLDGNEMGALEKRERLCVVAISKGLDGIFSFDGLKPVRQKEASLNDVLDVVDPGSDLWRDKGSLFDKAERDAKNGKNFKMQVIDGSESFCGTIGRHYAKWRSTEPLIAHPDKDQWLRKLTPVEHARVKTIPESLVADCSDTIAQQILGQSVVFCAFEAVGQHLGHSLNTSLVSKTLH